MTVDPLPGRSTYIGLFFVTLSTLMYEILLTRIFSVTMLYHFAFVALSVAMFGMTVGALVVYLLPQVFTHERLPHWLALSSLLFPIAIVLSFLTELSVPFRVHPSLVAIYAIVFTYAVIAVPFVVSGIVVCLALTGYPSRVSRLYAADLAGAAAGCVLLIPVLDYSDGPTAVLWVAWLASLGAAAMGSDLNFRNGTSLAPPRKLRSDPMRRAAAVLSLLLLAAAAGHTILVWKQFPLFRILYVKGSFEARPLYEKWNSYSRVRVNGSQNAWVVPQGWGLSTTLPADIRVRQLQMDIDVVAGTVMTGYDGTPSSVPHLAYDLTNVAYGIRPNPRALVIGAGGGRDVLSALALGATSVVAVEINKDILRTVNGRFGVFTGHIDRDPRVRFVNDEARSYVARSAERFDLIQISLIDTWAATAAGAFVLSENSVYTVEAWTMFLRHLSPDGLLSVSRWYFRDSPAEMYRTTTLAMEALRRVGVSNPRAHVAVVRNMNLANRPETPDGVGTLLVSARPFTESELAALERTASALRFEVMLTPSTSADPVFTELTGANASSFVELYPLRIAPPTDDSPFFFNMLRLRDIFRVDLLESGKQSNNLKAVATVGVLLGTVTLLTLLCIVFPLWVHRDRAASLEGSASLVAFFVAIGLGFMLIETSQMQRLIIALGHPTYGLTVVLFALLLSSGLGSFLAPARAGGERAAVNRLIALVIVLAIYGLLTPLVVGWSESASTPVRIAVAIAVLAPAGLLMGMAFPLGMTLAQASAPGLTPWLWGLNGAASVVASVLGVCIALTWSISAAFWTGCACYAAAVAAYAVGSRFWGSPLPRSVTRLPGSATGIATR